MAAPSAKSTQNANLVRQKAYNVVYGGGGTASSVSNTAGQSPAAFYAFKALFIHLAMNKGNPDLQYVPLGNTFSSGTLAAETGVLGAATLYGLYARKANTSTATYVRVSDNSTSIVADSPFTFGLTGAKESVFSIWPDGHAFTNGIVVNSVTSSAGTSNSGTANGNAAAVADYAQGFLIVA